jgi:hypothetical protein
MTRMSRLCIAALVALATWSNVIAQAPGVTVNAGTTLGAPPQLLAANVWIVAKNDLRNRYYIERFFADQQVNVVQYTLSFDIFLQDTQDIDDYLKRLERVLLRDDTVPKLLMEKVRAANARLVVGFEPYAMPKWLSSRPGDDRQAFVKEKWWTIERVSPPRDYQAAGRLAAVTLRFLRERVGIRKLGWYVGHEPETQWLGNEATLFRYYTAAARAAKQFDPDIKVGGLGSYNAIQGTKVGCGDKHFTPAVQEICRNEGGWANPSGEPLTRSFMRFAAKNSVPVDFINWHAFGNVPPEKHAADAQVLQRWLREAKLPDARLYPSDWTYWSGPYPADYLDTQEAAAYVVSSLNAMAKSGIAWHGHDLNIEVFGFEQQRIKDRSNAEFIGDWPLLTRRGVAKPVYNAFRAVSLLTSPAGQPAMLATSVVNAPDLGALATRRSDGVYVLLGNYVPGKARGPQYALLRFLASFGLASDEIQLVLTCTRTATPSPELAERCRWLRDERLADKDGQDLLALLGKARTCLKEAEGDRADAITCLRDEARALGNPVIVQRAEDALQPILHPPGPVTVTLNVANLPFDPARKARAYWIDARNANACAANKATEPAPTSLPCGGGGTIDQAIAPVVKMGQQAKSNATDPTTIYASLRREMDRINARPDVALTASATPVGVTGGRAAASLQVQMEPNAVVLLVLPPR